MKISSQKWKKARCDSNSFHITVIATQSNVRTRKRLSWLYGIDGPKPRIIATRQDVYSEPEPTLTTQPRSMNTSKYVTYAISIIARGILLPSRDITLPPKPSHQRHASSSIIDVARVVARVPRLLPRRDRVEPRFLDLGHGGAATDAAAHVGAALAG